MAQTIFTLIKSILCLNTGIGFEDYAKITNMVALGKLKISVKMKIFLLLLPFPFTSVLVCKV